ncbi:MAG: hypothetical protein V9G19_10170 [Tetrasphaera sp.]
MALLLVYALLTVVVMVVIIVAIARLTQLNPDDGDSPPAAFTAVARWTTSWRWLGLAVGFAVGGWAFSRTEAGLGRLALLAPAIAAAGVLLGTTIGEATAQPRRGTQRTASLMTRTWSDLLPRARTAIVGGGLVLLTTLLTLGWLAGSADDQGRPGRSLTATCVETLPGLGSVTTTRSNGPWPGSFYAVPAALAVGACLLLALLGAGAIFRRANPSSATDTLVLLLRRNAIRNVLNALGVVLFGMAAPTALFIASAAGGNDCIRGGDAFARILLLVAAAATIVGFALLAQLLIPARLPTSPPMLGRSRADQDAR